MFSSRAVVAPLRTPASALLEAVCERLARVCVFSVGFECDDDLLSGDTGTGSMRDVDDDDDDDDDGNDDDGNDDDESIDDGGKDDD